MDGEDSRCIKHTIAKIAECCTLTMAHDISLNHFSSFLDSMAQIGSNLKTLVSGNTS
jgi:hypothetical protein